MVFLKSVITCYRQKLGMYISQEISNLEKVNSMARYDSGIPESTFSLIRHGNIAKGCKNFLTATTIGQLKSVFKLENNKQLFLPNDDFIKEFLHELLKLCLASSHSNEKDEIQGKILAVIEQYVSSQYCSTLCQSAQVEQYYHDNLRKMLKSFKSHFSETFTTSEHFEKELKEWIAYKLVHLYLKL